MPDDHPVIPAGDIARKFNLPRWLRWILDLFRGTRISAGPVDIQLEQGQGPTPPQTGLDAKPHFPTPPPIARRRR